jgi:hypothetical protein
MTERRPYHPRRSRVTVSRETERPCSICGNLHSGKHYYCAKCRAAYMVERRQAWKHKAKENQQLADSLRILAGDVSQIPKTKGNKDGQDGSSARASGAAGGAR